MKQAIRNFRMVLFLPGHYLDLCCIMSFGGNMKEIRASVKDIAEYLYGGGDLANDRLMAIRQQEGISIHQYWQSLYKENDQKEVYVASEEKTGDIFLIVSGRIDGIVTRDEELMLEEIKSTRQEPAAIDETTYPAHLAQAKIYAHLYARENKLKRLTVVLTYVNVDTKESNQIEKNYSAKILENYYNKAIQKYIEWVMLLEEHEQKRAKSIEGLNFPFDSYRPRQRDMMASVYRNILEKGTLYLTAPTGIGKTIGTIFPALKAINEPRQKVFYLTAKNDGKQIALDTVSLLETSGLHAKTCELTAKDRMCFLKERDCDPENCKYARGYYKKIYKAIRDAYSNATLFTSGVIKSFARKHVVCPFEMSLDLSNYCDIVICDYNYVFDPRVRLMRYFEERSADPILLIDEAHNLVQRSREMYSATVTWQMFRDLEKLCQNVKPSPKREISRIVDLFQELELELIEVDFVKYEEQNEYLIQLLKKLLLRLDQILFGEKKVPNRSQIIEAYFSISQFVRISEFYNQEFVFLLEKQNDDVFVSIKCLNASGFINKTIGEYALSALFFSATLEPIDYYKTLLTEGKGNDSEYPSPFKKDNLLVLIGEHVSTRYQDRKDSVSEIALATKALISGKKGNYIVFFPSYEYLKMVEERLDFDSSSTDIIIQTRQMSQEERSSMVMLFKTRSEKTQVGLFVMGGVFGESIDLIGDMLSGVLVVGVGLPALSPYNNILRSHFDLEFGQGFDFAYTYPGLNKVIQAVGRVIRTETDRGVAILMDDRFASNRYIKLYPRQWDKAEICGNTKEIEERIARFWQKKEK